MADRTSRTTPVDREKTCPFLLRVFVKPGSHHDPERDYQVPDRLPVSNECQLYAWKDTTLRDICLQLLDSNPSIKSNLPLKFSIRLVFLDTPRDLSTSSHNSPLPRYKSQDLGSIFCRDLTRPVTAAPANKSLHDVRFCVGDFVDIALISSFSANPTGGTSAPSEAPRPSFGIRGAARGFASAAPASESTSWARSAAPPRWGGAPERRGGSGTYETSHPPDNGRWGHNSVTYSERANGGHRSGNDRYRERGGPRWASTSAPRRDSRERSPPRRRRL
ncbi:hypothetical protein PTTG_05784 [Puccinia triticina 1-1 BBBD Race 1]|uniref:Histone deacetylase complex subunit SAP18 n=2 Tax=Puccinia triticina TaxID=208348 RepID=A0A0C4EY85_PUCT1|nr:uncharacterized protein PtA15_6A798 [Puccinia triticina]OAV97091.1 hypothetical protein PTTG_05784 [Puccinia triticina 1-1 BBBD Race 1]WAQ86166.1 hypothetical protein PtA15_6A798 [Puccinia triticina]WAR56053.1 hypothetical protein PtB15_6B797 [Puccinia triticina]